MTVKPILWPSRSRLLHLRHVVITSVTRDDLPDGGASAFSQTVRAIRKVSNRTTIEVLIPDFQGSADALRTVIASRPDVIGHNLETVPRLYPDVASRVLVPAVPGAVEARWRVGREHSDEIGHNGWCRRNPRRNNGTL